MPALQGFSDNLFETREDVLRAAYALLGALMPYRTTCGSKTKLPVASGTGFDEIAAQLEGFSRPLWVVADLMNIQSISRDNEKPVNGATQSSNYSEHATLDLGSWIRGLAVGVDPQSDQFWGHLHSADQRMVEMEPIAYALLSAPTEFLSGLGKQGDSADTIKQNRSNLVEWLSEINHNGIPPSNWRWFRVLVNLALVKVCNVPYSTVKNIMEADLEVLDSFYLRDGWSSDGLWTEDKKQVDYYSGSFAIQYSQLAYIRFAGDLHPGRVERYRSDAIEFAKTFWRYFDVNGAAIPFGRSLTYRFTFAAFWSAVVVADVKLPAPLDDLGVIKGLLLRHLRWWAKQKDIFYTDGTLNIGYTYPNMYMSEDYNSPQSVYWCLKTLSVLRLPSDHPFWTCEERPHPLTTLYTPRPSLSHEVHYKTCTESTTQSNGLASIEVVGPPMHIICSTREHHFLLSSGQSTRKSHKAREAKYSKFAYSSAFAFSVPVGPTLEQMAPDSTLSITKDGGETWRSRYEQTNAQIRKMGISVGSTLTGEVEGESVPILVSTWQPWKNLGINIETTLIPPLKRWPGWHIRLHKLTFTSAETIRDVQCVDAGFAIFGQKAKGRNLPRLNSELESAEASDEIRFGLTPEGVAEDDFSCLILSAAGASGAYDLSASFERGGMSSTSGEGSHPIQHIRKVSILRPDSNTNLVSQRTLMPTICHTLNQLPSHSETSTNGEIFDGSSTVWMATGVFAIAASAGLELSKIKELWRNKPSLLPEMLDDQNTK